MSEPSTREQMLEARYARAEANFLRLLESTTDAIAVHRGGKILYANPAALKLFGYRLRDVIGRPLIDFVSSGFKRVVADRVMQTYIRRDVTPEIEERLIHADGSDVPVEVVAIPLLFEGKPATLVHIRDIRARKIIESRLRAADRLATVGMVAAGIAHEVNTPLTYALMNARLLEERVDRLPIGARGEIRSMVAAVVDGVARAARAAHDVKVFSGPDRRAPGHVDLHRVLDSCASLVKTELCGRARLVKRYGVVPRVLGNEARLAQIFLNLLLNAAQAIPAGSEESNEVVISTTARDGTVRVTIRDTGVGIPRELHAAIFEPLFTTKRDGSGLGLAIARALADDEDGALTLLSSDKGATVFAVDLTAAPRDVLPVEPPRPRTRGKRILVVEDEPRLAQSLRMLLSDHETTIAASGRDALDRLRADARFDVVLCDLFMNDIDGIELHRRILESWPELDRRIVFLTGGAETPRAREFLASVSNRRLDKPFEPTELLDLVDALG